MGVQAVLAACARIASVSGALSAIPISEPALPTHDKQEWERSFGAIDARLRLVETEAQRP